MNLKELIIQFVKFGIVGFVTTCVSYGVYSLVVYVGGRYLIGNIIGFIIGTLNSFIWNSIFVLKKDFEEKRNVFLILLKTFLVYGLSNLVLSSFILILVIEKLKVSEYIAPLFVLCITVPVNFLVNKFWTYKATRI